MPGWGSFRIPKAERFKVRPVLAADWVGLLAEAANDLVELSTHVSHIHIGHTSRRVAFDRDPVEKQRPQNSIRGDVAFFYHTSTHCAN